MKDYAIPIADASRAGRPTAAAPLALVETSSEVPHRWWRRPASVLLDVGLLLALGVAFPFAILLVGAPFALAVRAVIELTKRF